MKNLIISMRRELGFMLRQGQSVGLLLVTLLLSGFAVIMGNAETTQQHQLIDTLLVADEVDRKQVLSKTSDPGNAAFYSFYLTYSRPSAMAFAALGERDVSPWKHRIRMLALEGQIYESDSMNPELSQAGIVDFSFVISVLIPLIVILFLHDFQASERFSGRFNILMATTSPSQRLWPMRIVVRILALSLCLLLPFWIMAMVAGAALDLVLVFTGISVLHILFWAILCYWQGRKDKTAPVVAATLLGIWLMVSFIVPVIGNVIIDRWVQSPEGGDIVLLQREAVNQAWDLPKQTTMDAFLATHPQWKAHSNIEGLFAWKWYYAFQQVGDQKAAGLSQAFRDARAEKHRLAGYISLLSPPMLVQRSLSGFAQTDVMAAMEYQQQVRRFHQSLRHFYYPFLFRNKPLTSEGLKELPQFYPKDTSEKEY